MGFTQVSLYLALIVLTQIFTLRSFVCCVNASRLCAAQGFDSYGKKCNSKFLLHYGFTIIENNREADGRCMNELSLAFNIDSVQVLVRNANTASLFVFELSRDFHSTGRRAKQSFLKAVKRTCRVSMWYSAQDTIDTISYLHIVCATRHELRMCSGSNKLRVSRVDNRICDFHRHALLLLFCRSLRREDMVRMV